MLGRFPRGSAALVCCALASGCFEIFPSPDFEVVATERHVRYVEEDDALELLEVYLGLVADEPEQAAGALERLANGWRRFPPQGGWMACDLDDLDSWMKEDEPEAARRLLARVKSMEGGVRVERAGLFLDDDGRVSFYRVLRIEDAAAVRDLANDVLNSMLRENLDERDEFEPEFPAFDRRTRELLEQAAREDHVWFRPDGVGLVLDVPMTGASAARGLAHLLREASAPEGRATVELFGYVRDLEAQDERVELSFAPGADGWFHFTSDPSVETYRPGLRDELEGLGLSFDGAPTLAEIRSLMGQG